MYRPIAHLSSRTQAQIKSSVQITSINDVVLELFKNSVDARATDIRISVNFAKGYCAITDNGMGIAQEEFTETGKLGETYCTSKNDQNSRTYGRYGRFFATLAGVALLSITSRCMNSGSVNRLILNETGRLVSHFDLEEYDNAIHNSGTHVVVRGLFAKLPVRVKYHLNRLDAPAASDREFDTLKIQLVNIILALPYLHFVKLIDLQHGRSYAHKSLVKVSVSENSDDRFLDVNHVHSTLSQAGLIEKVREPVETVSVKSASAIITGVISLEPKPSKHLQFMSFDCYPIQRVAFPDLFSVVNTVFEQSTFGLNEVESEFSDDEVHCQVKGQRLETNVFPSKSTRLRRKGIDRWPMFYIRINVLSQSAVELLHPDHPIDREISEVLDEVCRLLKLLAEEFLKSHSFLVTTTNQRSQKKSIHASGDAASRTETRANPTLFSAWPRIKASRKSPIDDLLCGLPFHEKIRNDGGDAVGLLTPASKQLDTSADAASGNSVENSPFLPSSAIVLDDTGGNVSSIEVPLRWVEPQTGRPILLNPRTGAILPEDTVAASTAVTFAAENPNLRKGRRDSTGKLYHQCDLPILVHNLEKSHGLNFLEENQSPIRDIGQQDFYGVQCNSSIVSKKICNQYFRGDSSLDDDRLGSGGSKMSRSDLQYATILGQVDSKFILMSIRSTCDSDLRLHSSFLVLVDQHAADERCKVEKLYQSVLDGTTKILNRPIVFEVSKREAQGLESLQAYFASWKCMYSVTHLSTEATSELVATCNTEHQAAVTALPEAIAERCRTNPRLVIDMLRHEIWLDRGHVHSMKHGKPPSQSWFHMLHLMPAKMVEMLNSRACRSSIMFNDVLTKNQCGELIQRLSQCQLPFQCAHGRPSAVVLADLGGTVWHDCASEDAESRQHHSNSELGQAVNETNAERSRGTGSTSSNVIRNGRHEAETDHASLASVHMRAGREQSRTETVSGNRQTSMILDDAYDDDAAAAEYLGNGVVWDEKAASTGMGFGQAYKNWTK